MGEAVCLRWKTVAQSPPALAECNAQMPHRPPPPLCSILSCFSDSAVFIAALPVWYKHKTGRYYPAVCFALVSAQLSNACLSCKGVPPIFRCRPAHCSAKQAPLPTQPTQQHRSASSPQPFVLLRLPWIFVETWIWTGLVYGLVGLAATAGHVLAFWAVLFALGECFLLHRMPVRRSSCSVAPSITGCRHLDAFAQVAHLVVPCESACT